MLLRALDDLIAEIATFDGDPTGEANSALTRADMVAYLRDLRLRVENRDVELHASNLARAMDHWNATGLPALSDVCRRISRYEKSAAHGVSAG